MKKKENKIITFIKGFIVGLGIILPISSSGLALVMGIYQRILDCINNFFSSIKKEKTFIIFTILGVIASCIVSCLLINYTYEKYKIATILLFIGLIIGGIPSLLEKTGKDYKVGNLLWTVIGIASMLGLYLVIKNGDAILSVSAKGLVLVFLAGLIAAGSMIIPGVSGSVVLIIIGYYKPMLEVIHNVLALTDLSTNFVLALVFGIGMIIGILLMSKVMDFFLKKYEKKSYFTVIGFVCASVIILILREMVNAPFSIIELLIGIILFVSGFMISFKYLKEE